MSTNWPHYKLTPTRYKLPAEYEYGMRVSDECNIYFGYQKDVGWRFVVENGGFRQVGSIYATKAELLADLPSYAAQWAKEWR